MNSHVLDASAVLAVLNGEKGEEKALQFFAGGIVSSVNAAEVLSKSLEKDLDIETAKKAFDLLQLEVVGFDLAQAVQAAKLRPLTRHLGLSLGDRCCLALAMVRNTTAVTADREWQKLSFCPVEVIR